ncbi:acyltransferase family protein [Adhaeribacter aerolatus]|nr:acyltransferase [Adhaeribacter aerolatus]
MNIIYTRNHVKALDGLRGIAVILVVLYHCFNFNSLHIITKIGWIGVDLFFVLSGFLITGILLDTKHEENSFRNFIGRRTLRIFPLYYFIIFLFFLFTRLTSIPHFELLMDNQIYFWTYTQNLFFAIEGWPKGSEHLNHFWSLAIEEQFYLFWPALILTVNQKNVLRVSFFLILICIVLRNLIPLYPFSYVFTLTRMDGLLAGGILAILIRENVRLLERIIPALLAISFLAILSIYLFTHSFADNNPLFIKIGYTLFDVFFGSIIIILFSTGKFGTSLRHNLERKFLLFFGKYSYGIYVYHWILFCFLNPRLLNFYSKLKIPFIDPQILAALTCTLLAIGVSYLSYNLFEKQFLKLKKYFSYSKEVTMPAVATASIGDSVLQSYEK